MYTTITGVTIVFPRSLFKIMPNTDREWENVLLKLEMLSLAYTEIIGILENLKETKMMVKWTTQVQQCVLNKK